MKKTFSQTHSPFANANLDTKEEVLEYVWVMSCFGDNPQSGGVMAQLFALGVVLYELFSAADQQLEREMPTFDASPNSPSMRSITLNDEAVGDSRPQKRAPSHSKGKVSKFISRLASRRVPRSLCALVKNLLDCSDGDFCEDDSYTSLDDLRLDLELMIGDPSRFLEDIPTNPVPALEIPDKLYGREGAASALGDAYRRHAAGGCSGVVVSGGAGVGKSRLATRVVRELTEGRDGYFLAAKFDQNKDVEPLSTIGNVLGSLCESFARDAAPARRKLAERALEGALGNQAGLLASIVPSLSRLLPPGTFASNDGVDSARVYSAVSMRFLFGELLSAISSHSPRPISLLLDDIQWCDIATLVLVVNLVSCIEGGNGSVFFAFCHRDDEVGKGGPFDTWLSSISMFALDAVRLEDMGVGDVNGLLSDALRLSPRITRSLATALHHKTRGNPLFLRQLLESLRGQNLVYFRMNLQRWDWDLNRIADMKPSDDVVALLVKEMRRMPFDLQLGLKVALEWPA